MRTTYDREADAAYIELVAVRPGEAVTQYEVPIETGDATVVLDFDRNGFLLGVEILGAAAILRDEVLTAAEDVTRE